MVGVNSIVILLCNIFTNVSKVIQNLTEKIIINITKHRDELIGVSGTIQLLFFSSSHSPMWRVNQDFFTVNMLVQNTLKEIISISGQAKGRKKHMNHQGITSHSSGTSKLYLPNVFFSPFLLFRGHFHVTLTQASVLLTVFCTCINSHMTSLSTLLQS